MAVFIQTCHRVTDKWPVKVVKTDLQHLFCRFKISKAANLSLVRTTTDINRHLATGRTKPAKSKIMYAVQTRLADTVNPKYEINLPLATSAFKNVS